MSLVTPVRRRQPVLAAATVAARERGRPGQAYNLADDLPATWQEVHTAMAEAFEAPPPRRLPRWLGAAASKEVPWRSHRRSGAGTRSA
jgi:hypothetical protein